MLMNVQPIPTVSERINEVRALTAQIVNREILPNETTSMLFEMLGLADLTGMSAATLDVGLANGTPVNARRRDPATR